MTDRANGQLPDGANVRTAKEPGQVLAEIRSRKLPTFVENESWAELPEWLRKQYAKHEQAVLDYHSTPVLKTLHAEIDRLREILARRDSQLAAAGVPCPEIPDGVTPPGVLQAYSDAHRAYKDPRDALQAHAAGLRAVLILDRKQCPRVPAPPHGLDRLIAAWINAGYRGSAMLLEGGMKLQTLSLAAATPSLPPYSPEIGAAADRYLMSVAFRGDHILPAMFQWGECWRAMVAAAPPPKPFRQDPRWSGMSLGMDGATFNLKLPEGSAEIVVPEENLEFLREESRDLWVGRLPASEVLALRWTLNEYLPPDVQPPADPAAANWNRMV